MVDYAQYPTMPHDFQLYSNQEQPLDFIAPQPFLPSSTYSMEPQFSASYEPMPMPALSEAPRLQDLQYHYDGIAQGVKPQFQYSPTGSPHSTSHSFDNQPPILSASSESGASVSSSNIGSPSLHPQYNDSWNQNGLGFAPGIVQSTPGFEYDGMAVADKVTGCVGESTKVPSTSDSSSSIAFSSSPPETPKFPSSSWSESSQSNVFKSPVTPASAKWSSPAYMRHSPPRAGPYARRNSLLSHEIRPSDIPEANADVSPSSPSNSSEHLFKIQSNFIPLESSCRFPSVSLLQSYGVENKELTASGVDPTLIQPYGNSMQFPQSPYPDMRTAAPSPYLPLIEHPPSPTLSHISANSRRPGSRTFKQGSTSPFLHTQQFQPYPTGFNGARRRSDASIHSHHSQTSRKSGSSYELDDETRDKGLCPLPECGRAFKDLKAHMLTHQNERPEKCPITTCEYHLKGFARKYDKNRHTLTHYKGTMVCGFCPGSGSAAEKSFNRADVFKRHLTSVHGVEQNPPNSRKKSPSGRKAYSGQQNLAGTCSTCSVTFANAQEFYEHLDDCVLRVVQQADPSEAINQKLLTSVAEDKDVAETLDRNGLPNSVEYTVPSYEEDEEEEEEEEVDNDDHNDDTYGVRRSRSGKGSLKSTKSH
ncbi:uncharacterized protein BDR25DRAFT_67087 [Lindgomyces ingoldianus]|uniref:Uncharacterized protein n=1 Tax=Lindgomyces ingoldianus TaxID=673940 RepID=A0ACB6RB47_9PLEO|nr:uncharacterized protein BDR25DRAFT_67087 [Lindgomyces ingoldianus]KAF2476539.1 hypothetical protein BDR25DRAFT_67087 [Lindgomyces ingoldianus]